MNLLVCHQGNNSTVLALWAENWEDSSIVTNIATMILVLMELFTADENK